jgi:hypothetical protein
MSLQKKRVDEKTEGFLLRVKIGEYEVELSGTHKEVMKTVASIPDIIANINRAFESAKPKTVATITVKTTDEPKTAKTSEAPVQNYPKIAATEDAEKAVLRILESDWGKWRPRTVEELEEALKTNDLKYSERVLASTLDGLAKKGLVKRWNTNTGSVYILAEKKQVSSGGK